VAASVPGFEANTWFGLFASGGTPREIVDKIHADVVQTFQEPEFQRDFLAVNMLRPAVMAPAPFADFIRIEEQKWGRIVRDLGLKVE
jgi:tripartite-type tricarboxylate transporter receptor subunit TctC